MASRAATGRTICACQNFLPGLAAVGGLVDAALVVVVPEMSHRADQNVIAVLGIDQNLCDVLAVFQADVGPVLAAVGGLVDAVADRDAVARPGLAGANPDCFRIRGIDGDRADRLRALAVEDGLVGRAAVHRLPHAAAGRADKHGDAPILIDGVDRGDAAAHHGRADVARRQSGNRSGIELVVALRDGNERAAEQRYNCCLHQETAENCACFHVLEVLFFRC